MFNIGIYYHLCKFPFQLQQSDQINKKFRSPFKMLRKIYHNNFHNWDLRQDYNIGSQEPNIGLLSKIKGTKHWIVIQNKRNQTLDIPNIKLNYNVIHTRIKLYLWSMKHGHQAWHRDWHVDTDKNLKKWHNSM
jgi:hypothetical protein